jgi:superfamily II DNA or RNA helicase
MVTLELRNSEGRVKGLPPEVADEISAACSYEVKGAEHSPLFKKGRWDGRKRLFNKQSGKFPMGLLQRVLDIMTSRGVTWTTKDYRPPAGNGLLDIEISDLVEKRPYQSDAADAAIAAGRSVLQVATGGGKTVIASILISRLKSPTLFLVHTKDLLYQAKGSFESMLIGEGVGSIGQIGDGIVDIQPVTVATMQTMSKILGVKYEKYAFDDADDKEKETDINRHAQALRRYLDTVDVVIWDEVHRVACDMAFGVSEALGAARYRIGLSASPWRDDGLDIMIEAAMGPISYRITASELIDLGYLVPPIIRRVKVPSSIPWYLDTRTYDQIYRAEIVENEYRNRLIMRYAADFMELNIPSLILVQQIKHGNKLKRLISEEYHPIDFLSGRDLSMVRNQTIQSMRDGERISLIASTIADEGLDIKRLAGLIMAGGGKSSTRALQRIGRVLRPFEGKTHALIIDFDDEALYLRDHAARRKEIYQTEPKFTILELE